MPRACNLSGYLILPKVNADGAHDFCGKCRVPHSPHPMGSWTRGPKYQTDLLPLELA